MGIKALQDFLETHCSSACVSVDLLKISRCFVPEKRGRYQGNGRFCLVVDAESCLDRLYGGFFSDWVCGGQWNRMLSFLQNLIQACQSANMDLVVFFNGSLESEKLDEWFADQVAQKRKVNMVLRHLNNKGTPPPKVWWNPPVFLRGALRMALRHLGVGVATSMDDHPQEVIGFCREHGMQGILAQDSVYAIFDPPRYFSSHNLKLTYKGSLETKEYIMDELAKCLDLNPNRFSIFASLLGNHILPDENLYEFVRELLSKSDESGKSVKPTPDNAIRAVVNFVRGLQDASNLDAVGAEVFKNSKGNKQELISIFKQSVQYYLNGTQDGFLKYRPKGNFGSSRNFSGAHNAQNNQDNSGYGDPNNPQIVVDPPVSGAGGSNGYKSKKNQNKQGGKSTQNSSQPQVSPEIMRIASERHQKGLMTPWIYQLLSQGEVKMHVPLEDDQSRDLPSSIDFYRPIRQTVYSVLLNLNKHMIIYDNQNKDKSENQHRSFEYSVKEWMVRRGGNSKPGFDIVMAKPVNWKTPSIERMWLGQQPEDKTRRLRAFLTCLQSDTPLMLNTQYVPQHLLILCCVLRYMLQSGRTLQRQELDAFLAMSVSPLLHDVQTMQDLKLPQVNVRGVHLASLFMSGVETSLFANDVCGAPIPWTMCCPWNFFDGKLFHFKLLKANNNTPLIDMCDGQVDQVLRVERMRQAIMEGLRVEFARPMLPSSMYTSYPLPPYAAPPFPYRPAGMRGMPQGMGGPEGGKAQGRGRGILGRSPVDARGGQLEIAGVVVGSWGPNLSSGGRGRPRGGGGGGGPLTPRVMSVGGPRRGRGMMQGPGMMRGGGGGNYGGPFRGRGMMQGAGMMRGGGGMGMRSPLMRSPLMRENMMRSAMMRGMPGDGMNRPIRDRGAPMYGMGRGFRMQERSYYNRGRGGAVRGIRRPAVRARPRVEKKKPVAKGRGTTVEVSGGNSAVVSVKEEGPEEGSNNTTAIFDDADESGSGAIGKGLMQNGIQSPDSGIHGDKSSTEINISA